MPKTFVISSYIAFRLGIKYSCCAISIQRLMHHVSWWFCAACSKNCWWNTLNWWSNFRSSKAFGKVLLLVIVAECILICLPTQPSHFLLFLLKNRSFAFHCFFCERKNFKCGLRLCILNSSSASEAWVHSSSLKLSSGLFTINESQFLYRIIFLSILPNLATSIIKAWILKKPFIEFPIFTYPCNNLKYNGIEYF